MIALAFLVPVRSASIKPGRASFGRVITPRLPDKFDDIDLFITLAGPFAHRRFAPKSNWLTDVGVAANMILGRGSKGTAAAKEKHLAFLVDHAKQFVDYFWPDIKAAAKALLEHETLTGDEISAVIRAARRKESTSATDR